MTMKKKCPFCDTGFDAGKKTNSDMNRHIRTMASKAHAERGDHPEVNSPAFAELAKRLGFRKISKSLEEQREMTAARKKRSREAKKKIRSGNVSVGDPMEMEKEDELSSLQFNSEITERIAQAIKDLMYSPKYYSLTENTRLHIDNPEVIPKPIDTLPLDPSFPQIAFHYLPL